MMRACGLAVVSAVVLGVGHSASAQVIQQGSLTASLRLIGQATGSSGGAPNFGVHAGDPRFLYVGEQNGRIRTLDFSQVTPLAATDLLDVGAVLGSTLMDDTGTGERGLLGAAFHPDFNNAANASGYRKFYTFTSETLASGAPHFVNPLESPATGVTYNHQSVIREWTANDPNAQGLLTINTATPSRVVMRIGKPGPFHNGGGMQFGADKLLYVSLGDGGGGGQNGGNDGGNNQTALQGHTNPGNPDTPGGWAGPGNAQDRRVPYGKIIRIKPTLEADGETNASPIAGAGWRVPKSNPYTADTNAATPVPGWQDGWVDEIYAYGFRNPFRISFDRDDPTRLYAADVGQDRNSFSREEVSLIVKGGNYGWVKKSGDQFNTNMAAFPAPGELIDPIAQYRTLAGTASTVAPIQPGGSGGLAAIGGFVYRGNALPAEFDGKYLFGDLNRSDGSGGRLLYFDPSVPGVNPVLDLSITGAVQKPNGAFVHGVAEDAAGEIYFLFGNGQIMKVVPVPEPSTAALALVALAGGLARRRRVG